MYQLFACPSEQSSWYKHIVDFNCLHSLLVVFNVCDMEFYARTVYVRVKTKSKSIIVRFFSIFNFNLGFFYKCLRLSLFLSLTKKKLETELSDGYLKSGVIFCIRRKKYYYLLKLPMKTTVYILVS